LIPNPIRACKNPRSADGIERRRRIVSPPAHYRGIPVTGKRDGRALPRGTYGTGTDEFRALLAPFAPASA
jgi:hypothetical protein